MAKEILRCNDSPKLKEISKLIEGFNYKFDRYQILTDIFEMAAIGLSNQVDYRPKEWASREERYKQLMQRYNPEDRQVLLKIFGKLFDLLTGMEENGFDDYLGKLYMMSGTSNDKTGQFFTPFSVSQLCANLSLSKEKVEEHIENGEIITINEPSCGSGGLLIAALDVFLHKYDFNCATNVLIDCGDLDKRCVHMCYLQLSLAGVPAVVRHMNTLTLEQFDEWHTPALIMQWPRFKNYLT